MIRIAIYGLVTAALLFLIQYQQEKNKKQDPASLEINEISFDDSLYIMEEQ